MRGILAALALNAALGGPVAAAGLADCVGAAAADDFAAKTHYQQGLHDLVVEGRPEFAALAALNLRLQVALAAARQAQVAYLLARDPARLDTRNGLARFTNFPWSEADAAALAAASAAYDALEAEIARLRAASDGHPDWPAMRAYVGAEVVPGPEFQALTARLQTTQEEVAAALASCRD